MSIREAEHAVGDLVYVSFKSNVLRIGLWRGYSAVPGIEGAVRLCLGLRPFGLVYEWVNADHVRSISCVERASSEAGTGNGGEAAGDAGPAGLLVADVMASRLERGDRLYVQYRNEVTRTGVYLGLWPLPWNDARLGVCFAHDALMRVSDWVDPSWVRAIGRTIPRGVIEQIEGHASL